MSVGLKRLSVKIRGFEIASMSEHKPADSGHGEFVSGNNSSNTAHARNQNGGIFKLLLRLLSEAQASPVATR
jgi:hypothetical protein